MRILHYSLGFPPYRTGGLTRFCVDLARTQATEGHQVGMLWPGEINPLRHQAIRKRKQQGEVLSFEIINPAPVPLDEGIIDVAPYMAAGDLAVFEKLFREFRPDVLHIHTLMGFQPALLQAAKLAGTKTVFTSHDYFGLCPKVTLFRNGAPCDCDHDCSDCVGCNATALSSTKIILLQSPFYRALKDSPLIRRLRSRHRTAFFEETVAEVLPQRPITEQATEAYRLLRAHYVKMLQEIDLIHFNSTLTQSIYLRYMIPKNSRVLPITHGKIADNRKLHTPNAEKLQITYLGPAKPFKGYGLLKETLDELWQEGKRDFALHMYSPVPQQERYMTVQNGYQYDELGKIFACTDVLVAPSLCYETFGFTVLEALSYGVPVIVSDRVGAKDLIADDFGIVVSPQKDALKRAVKFMMERGATSRMNQSILKDFSMDWIKRDPCALYL